MLIISREAKMPTQEYINSKLCCPVCNLEFAKNYINTHLTRQHHNIYGRPEWANSRYAKNFERIKNSHKKKWSTINNNKVECHQQEDQVDRVEPLPQLPL
tara:strand:+ start:376 stop:675 length:300 start_codon:yes stop_codon:yes gene_type:complete